MEREFITMVPFHNTPLHHDALSGLSTPQEKKGWTAVLRMTEPAGTTSLFFPIRKIEGNSSTIKRSPPGKQKERRDSFYRDATGRSINSICIAGSRYLYQVWADLINYTPEREREKKKRETPLR